MKKTLTIFAALLGLVLQGQVKQEEPFTDLFNNMGFSATHTVLQYKDGSIWIQYQNLEYKTISDIEMVQIGDDIESAILCYQEMLNVLNSEKGTYELSNGMSVYRGVSGIMVESGDEATDGWTMITKNQCKKGIKKLSALLE